MKTMTVRDIQNLLQFLDFYRPPLVPDDKLGPGTKKAVREFQRAYGLTSDGIPGTATQKALRDAVAHGMPVVDDLGEGNVSRPAPQPGPGGIVWERFPHLSPVECECHCGRKYCNGFPHDIAPALLQVAEDMRRDFGGAPIIPSSVVRCDRHNAAVGGVATSRHKLGRAMDVRWKGIPPKQALARAQADPRIKYAYEITRNGKPTGYIHMDTGRG